MMNTLIRLFTVYLFVNQMLVTLKDSRAEAQVLEDPCVQAQKSYQALVTDLIDKCRGLGIKNCIAEAEKCNNQDEGATTGAGMQLVQNALLPILSGGMGLPIVGGMYGGANAETFRCMPNAKKDSFKTQVDKMHEDAKKVEEKANDYNKEVIKERKDIQKEIADLKKDFTTAIEESKKSQASIKSEEREIRNESEKAYLEVLNDVNTNEEALAKNRIEKEELENSLGDLYYDIIANPETGCDAIKEKQVDGFTQSVQSGKASLAESMKTVSDYYEQEIMRQRFEKQHANNVAAFKARLKKDYGKCLQLKTVEYKRRYKQYVNEIEKKNKAIEQLENTKVILNKKIADIPQTVNEAIQALRSKKTAEAEAAMQNLRNLQEQVSASAQDYTSRSVQASAEYNEAKNKLNMAQMQRANFQAVFQMTTFGDAAPVVDARNMAHQHMCDVCSKEGQPKSGCPKVSGSSSDRDGSR